MTNMLRMTHKLAPRHLSVQEVAIEHAPHGRHNGALQAEDLRALSARGTVKTFRKQTVIFSEGDETDDFHVIISGRVKIFVSDEQGKEIALATLGPDEYFGEMVVDEGPRCASMITLEPARVAIIPRVKCLQFLLEHPVITLKVMQKLGRHVRSLTQKVKSLGLMDVSGRVARLLAELSAINGGTRVIERMTQQEIANRVGASREMISRVMRDLAAGGYIAVDKKYITILKRPRPH